MHAVALVRADVGGLDGDRYARGAGTFSRPSATGTAMTLVEAEALETVVLPDGTRLAPEDARRNVVTRGIALNALVGRRFAVGEVECYGQRRCQPCAHWQRLTRTGVLRGFVHRGGLRADVLTPGVLRPGDPVRPLD
jgi:MOSC domain-containing protein YiiM